MEKVSGVVILYNPDRSVFENINSYLHEVDILYAVDNSEIKKQEIVNKLMQNPKIKYIDNEGNKGIGYALNTSAKRAIKDGYNWLLMMDQDSKFLSSNFIDEMTKANYIYNKVAMITPNIVNIKPRKFEYKSEFSIVSSAITSGSLLNLKAYQEIGDFKEDFFIDYIDHEYCLRARSLGYIIVQSNRVFLKHNIGVPKVYVGITVSHHSATRRYYITRNRLMTMKMYEDFDQIFYNHERYSFLIEIFKILFFEKDKLRKLQMVYKGYKDYKKFFHSIQEKADEN